MSSILVVAYCFIESMPGIEDTEQIQYEKFDELQRKNEELARQLKEKIKLVGKTNVAFLPLYLLYRSITH